MSSVSHSRLSQLASLREEVRAIESLRPQEEREVLPFGIPDIDGRLAWNGLPLGALHEVAGSSRNHDDDAAATLFIASIAARVHGPILWVVRRRDLFAPGLFQAGLDPQRVLYAEARDDAELLALMEDGLRYRGLGAVIGEAKRVSMASTRRLQLAAEEGRTIPLLLKQAARQDGDALGSPSAAVTRWRVSSAPSSPVPWNGLGRSRWHLQCVRQRGGDSFELQVEAPDETGRLALPAGLADRPVAEDRAPLRAVG
jgi:protein ImuA